MMDLKHLKRVQEESDRSKPTNASYIQNFNTEHVEKSIKRDVVITKYLYDREEKENGN